MAKYLHWPWIVSEHLCPDNPLGSISSGHFRFVLDTEKNLEIRHPDFDSCRSISFDVQVDLYY
ncbi:hypothetical protein LCGC14_1070830 [marine sediment metagenome]|uniref:Uncharacterized protein n=1 Tax=marine sediment metagenome TaxID=412755 RepID=A0A0F9QP46_9ZZZZ